MELEKFRVLNAPPTVYYIPNFITPGEEAHIIRNIYTVPKPKWTCLSNRRLQDYGGVPHEKGMIPEKIPDWLQKYVDKITILDVFGGSKPNQILVNEYLPGQGIMPHTDGPLFYQTITTISCGSHTVLEFVENNEQRNKVCELFLERCSLVIIKDDMYSKYLHSIENKEVDCIQNCVNKNSESVDIQPRNTRLSLTIRNVPKVLKIKLFK